MTGSRHPHPVDVDFSDPLAAKAELERLRAAGHDVLVHPPTGLLFFLTAGDAEELLTSPKFGAAVAMVVLGLSGVEDGPLHGLWSELMFGKDGEEHHRLRHAVAGHFSRSAVERLRPDVERFSTELLDGLDPTELVDLWTAYAVPLSARAACRAVGVADHRWPEIAPAALRVVRAFGIMDDPEIVADTTEAAVELTRVVRAAVEERPAEGSVLADLLDADHLTEREVESLTANLLFGGLDATAKAITSAVAVLHDHPHAWDALVRDPARRAPTAAAESLRYTPPASAVFRLAIEDSNLAGTEVPAFCAVAASLDAVCRDPALVEDPDEFRVDRPAGRQYAFGAGNHYCLGSHLASQVLTTALRDLATRFPGMRPDITAAEAPWTQDPFRGPVSLPVHLLGAN